MKDVTTALIGLLPLLGAWLAVMIRKLISHRLYASSVGSLRVRARAVSADAQRVVDAAKAPGEPGEWSKDVAAGVRADAVRRVKRLEPLACKVVLEALDGDTSALDELIGTHVEEAVREMRVAGSKPL